MILTQDFVFLHVPKTGGTFVTHCLKSLYASLERFAIDTVEFSFAKKIIAKHGGVDEIPERFRHLPILVCARDPLECYVSNYTYRGWQAYPDYTVNVESLEQRYPGFPNLDFGEFLNLMNDPACLRVPGRIELLERFDMGGMTWRFLKTLSPDPVPETAKRWLDWLEEHGTLDPPELERVTFIRKERLNDDLCEFLVEIGHDPETLGFVREERKVFPQAPDGLESVPDVPVPTPSDEIRQYVRHKERLLYALFPQYASD